jgi:hypothetical protein
VTGPSRAGGALEASRAGSPWTSSAPAATPAPALSASAAAIAQRRRSLIPDIIRHAREAFLKIFVASSVLLLAATQASADELVTGALRDQDGTVVVGARITALDAAGAVIGSDRSAADGTFAVTAPSRPTVLLVNADDTDGLRLPVPPDGSITAVVQRHRAADRVPTVADVAALPAGSLSEIGSVVPYWIVFPTMFGDRWLARGHGVATIEGLPFYRRAGSADAGSLLPDHATGNVSLRDSLQSPFYGDRAGGGLIDAGLFDRLDDSRATSGDGSFQVGHDPALLAATSWDPDGQRRVAAARASRTVGPVNASLVALTGDLPGSHYAGLGVGARGSARAIDLGARLNLTRVVDDGASLPDSGSVVGLTVDASGRGPNALAVRGRWRDDRGAIGGFAVEHRDAALVVGTTRGAQSGTRVAATVALAFGLDRGYGAVPQTALAVLPSLSIDTPLSAQWSLHAGTGGSTLGTPGVAIAHSSLGEAGLTFSDHRRVRLDLLAYTEGTGAPVAVTRGFAANLGWEVAPRLSLRAWSLSDGDEQYTVAPAYPGAPVLATPLSRTFRRELVWLTWDAVARFDVLVRAGALEGNVRVPLGARYTLTLSSARRLIGGTRELSIGLSAR